MFSPGVFIRHWGSPKCLGSVPEGSLTSPGGSPGPVRMV